jgi:hypothetical protein
LKLKELMMSKECRDPMDIMLEAWHEYAATLDYGSSPNDVITGDDLESGFLAGYSAGLERGFVVAWGDDDE